MTYNLAAAAILPGVAQPARETLPPNDWKLWESPSANSPYGRLPIDNRIDELRRAAKNRPRNKPRLRSPDDLFATGVLCPYYVAREYIIHAVDLANEEADKDKERQALARHGVPDRKRAEEAARELADQIETFLGSLPPPPPAADLRRGMNRVDAQALIEQDRALQAAGAGLVKTLCPAAPALRHWADASRATHGRGKPNAADRDSWLWTFAKVLGEAWFMLTGQQPAKALAGPFPAFVRAAYESLGGDLPGGAKWLLNAVTYAREGVAEYDRPDATAKDMHAPGAPRAGSILIAGKQFIEGAEPNTISVMRVNRPERITSVEVVRRHRECYAQAKEWLAIARDENRSQEERAAAYIILHHRWAEGKPMWRGILSYLGYAPAAQPAEVSASKEPRVGRALRPKKKEKVMGY